MKYRINLIHQLRLKEKKEREQKSTLRIMIIVAFTILLISIGYSVATVLRMKLAIQREKNELARIEVEYRKYRTTKMIVNKEDIELLDRLQNGRLFWTKKLAAMAYHLPNKPPNLYWITDFTYKEPRLKVNGFGFISPRQEQLITLDDYLNSLRKDTSFSDVFTSCYINSTIRDDEGYQERVSFEYSAERPMKKRGLKR
jgi:hypothetical protein